MTLEATVDAWESTVLENPTERLLMLAIAENTADGLAVIDVDHLAGFAKMNRIAVVKTLKSFYQRGIIQQTGEMTPDNEPMYRVILDNPEAATREEWMA